MHGLKATAVEGFATGEERRLRQDLQEYQRLEVGERKRKQK